MSNAIRYHRKVYGKSHDLPLEISELHEKVLYDIDAVRAFNYCDIKGHGRMKLSILIATVPERKGMFEVMHAELDMQCCAFPDEAWENHKPPGSARRYFHWA